MCSREGLLDLESEEYVVSLSLMWAGLSFSSLLFPRRGETLAAQPGAHLCPASRRALKILMTWFSHPHPPDSDFLHLWRGVAWASEFFKAPQGIPVSGCVRTTALGAASHT